MFCYRACSPYLAFSRCLLEAASRRSALLRGSSFSYFFYSTGTSFVPFYPYVLIIQRPPLKVNPHEGPKRCFGPRTDRHVAPRNRIADLSADHADAKCEVRFPSRILVADHGAFRVTGGATFGKQLINSRRGKGRCELFRSKVKRKHGSACSTSSSLLLLLKTSLTKHSYSSQQNY